MLCARWGILVAMQLPGSDQSVEPVMSDIDQSTPTPAPVAQRIAAPVALKRPSRFSVRYLWTLIPVIVVVSIALALFDRAYPVPDDLVSISVGGILLVAGIADSDAERAQGLSGRPSLPEGEGLLFIFPSPGIYGFWMKDMHFAIDILWFDSDKRLVDISRRIDPSTYPQSFAPQLPAQYVLEVPAGYADAKNIKLGDQLSF